ncbi:hypothetical protein MFIFM68171_01561 [Madurella fahalii]|uniref:Proline-rich protein n=1 Tax=Madurella fahalii TaxID=1157608 RepID=A0ABQ0G0R4_9PEZI
MKYTTTFIAAVGFANAAIIPSAEQTRDDNSGSELAQRGPKGGGGGGGSNKPGVNLEVDPLAPLNALPWLAPPPGGAPPPQKREPEHNLAQRGPKGGGGGGGSNKPGVNLEVDPLAPLNALPWLAPPPGEAPPPQKRESEHNLAQRGPKGGGGGGGSNKPGVNFEIDPLAPLNALPWLAPPPGGAPPPQKREPEHNLAQRGPKGGGGGGGSNKPGVNLEVDPLAPLNALPWLAPPPGEAPPPQKRNMEAVYNELIARNPEAEPIVRPVVDFITGLFGA